MEVPIFDTYMTFSHHYLCCFTIVPLFVLDRPMAWNGAYNTLASKICVKLLKPPKIKIPTTNTSFWIR